MTILYQIQLTRVVEIWYNTHMDNKIFDCDLPPYLAYDLDARKKGV